MDTIIKQFEGCKLQAYPDPITKGEPYTIGWGSTVNKDGKPFKNGDVISQAMADALLTDYLMKNIVPHFKEIPYQLTLDQKRALASLWYNIKGGFYAFKKSKCFEAVCKKDYATIFKEWDWGVNQLKGLAKRRARELDYFLKDL